MPTPSATFVLIDRDFYAAKAGRLNRFSTEVTIKAAEAATIHIEDLSILAHSAAVYRGVTGFHRLVPRCMFRQNDYLLHRRRGIHFGLNPVELAMGCLPVTGSPHFFFCIMHLI